MIEISLCMIVKNEEKVLSRCFNSIRDYVDEIVIVDTGSTDKTKEIAANYTNLIYDFEWVNDFALARNFAFSKATKDYVMWLDADDEVTKENGEKLLLLKESLKANVGQVYMKYNIAFDEFSNPTFSYYRERLFKRGYNPVWHDPIHEYVTTLGGENLMSEIEINHKKEGVHQTNRNLKIFDSVISKNAVLNPRMQYYYARELMYDGQLSKAIRQFKKFLNMKDGWSQNKLEACLELANCYLRKNKVNEAYQALLQSFCYSLPTAEIFCKLGEIDLSKNELKKATYWYHQAFTCKKEDCLGFIQNDYYMFIPSIQLCVVYYRQGNKKLAKYYNEIAGKVKPLDKSYLHNKNLFEAEEKGEIL